jgi:hypothetical protein
MNNLYFADFVGNFIRIGADNSIRDYEIKNPTVSDSNRYCTSDKKYKLTQNQLSKFNLIDIGIPRINGKYGFARLELDNSYSIYSSNNNVKIWNSGSNDKDTYRGEKYKAKLTPDGNFSIGRSWDNLNIKSWSSNTSNFGTPPYFIVLSNVGHLVISDSDGRSRDLNIGEEYWKIGNVINMNYPTNSYFASTPLYIPPPDLLQKMNAYAEDKLMKYDISSQLTIDTDYSLSNIDWSKIPADNGFTYKPDAGAWVWPP